MSGIDSSRFVTKKSNSSLYGQSDHQSRSSSSKDRNVGCQLENRIVYQHNIDEEHNGSPDCLDLLSKKFPVNYKTSKTRIDCEKFNEKKLNWNSSLYFDIQTHIDSKKPLSLSSKKKVLILPMAIRIFFKTILVIHHVLVKH